MMQKENIGDKISEFIQKNRKGIFIAVGVLFFLLIGTVAYLFVGDLQNNKAIAEVEELNRKFTDLNFYISQGEYSEEVDELLDDLKAFTDKVSIFTGSKTFARSKAWSLAGRIYSSREDWPQAETAWINSAKAGEKTYLGPIALFEAAVAAEEQGNLEQAIDLLQQCVTHRFDFPSAPRAQFSIGRLYEQLGDDDMALEAYRTVLINWPDMPVFQHLARSQIVKIEDR